LIKLLIIDFDAKANTKQIRLKNTTQNKYSTLNTQINKEHPTDWTTD